MNTRNQVSFDQLKIAKVYDRARTLPPRTLALWRKILLRFLPKSKMKKILDLGAGTGLFAAFLRDTFQAQVVGVEPSRQMLSEAKRLRQKNTRFLPGKAENIPLPAKTVDLVFLSMIFPHLGSVRKALSEIIRVLRPAGFVVVVQATKETNRHVPFFKFFPESKRIADRINPASKDLRQTFEKQNFRTIISRYLRYQVARNYRAYYQLIALRGYSVLRLIPAGAFQKRLKEFAKYSLDPKRRGPVFQTTSLFIFQKNN